MKGAASGRSQHENILERWLRGESPIQPRRKARLDPIYGKRNPPKIVFTPELLEQLGATGKTHAEIAKDLKIDKSVISRAINKSLTNERAFKKGRSSYEQRTRKI